MPQIWQPCNIYNTANIEDSASIGAFSEIGNNVFIGPDVRIGAMCYIPEGVEILGPAFIGPRVTFTNDKYPPSDKDTWEKTIVLPMASIGAGSTILPGIVIGAGATIGAGSVVTKSVPDHETWAGVPARKIGYEELSKT